MSKAIAKLFHKCLFFQGILQLNGFVSELFYIVDSGDFEATFSQAGLDGAQEPGKVVQQYNAYSNPCLGELALMYNKPVQATPIDSDTVALVQNCVLAGPLERLLRSPLDEHSSLVANVLLAIELLHKDGVVYRGISPDVLMVDRRGRIQLVDLRFAKPMNDKRTFTVCDMADFLAPEVIQGQGHGLASDWWAVGVLMYFMLQTELPFGSSRDNKVEIFGRIARRQLTFPPSFSPEARDLIDKLLVLDPSRRLGCDSQGASAIRGHPWFRGMNWDKLLDCNVEVPSEIMTRLQLAIAFLPVDDSYQVFDLQPDEDDPPWLDGW